MSKKSIYAMAFGIPLLSLALLASTPAAYAERQATPPSKNTLNNLLAAYNSESNDRARYLAFAQKADEEGYGQVASLFRAIARAKQVRYEHYAALIKKLGGVARANIETPLVKGTRGNLESALRTEGYKRDVIYLEFFRQAKKDKIKSAIDSFKGADAIEAVYVQLFKEALGNLDAWKGKGRDFFVCPVCANVMEKLYNECPICGTPKKKFITVN